MADVDQSQFSLLSLEEELTCSICLSPFDCPVTIPCGHNFCQDCLLPQWVDSYSCPQCRAVFPTRPELTKNTVLSSVVKTFKMRSNKSQEVIEESKEKEKDDVIRCDTCMEAEASQTCLTCMVSFCEEHLRPHRENPKFSVHKLCEPVGDLSERLCLDHQKLIEFFCSEHGRPICRFCLQQAHRGCTFISPEEQRNQIESNLRDKLGLLETKIERTETVLIQMKDIPSKLKDASSKRKMALAGMYQQIRDMLALEEREAQHEVDREVEIGQTKVQDFTKRFTENAENMRKARENINSLLGQSQTLAFLQASFDLPRVVNFDPYAPRINLDTKKLTATQDFAAVLKEHLSEILKQPVEARLLALKPGGPESSASAEPESDPPEQRRPPRSHSPGRPPIQPVFQPYPVPVYNTPDNGWNSSQYAQSSGPPRVLPFKAGQHTNKRRDSSHQPSRKNKKGNQPTEDKLGKNNLARSAENLLDFDGKVKQGGLNSLAESKQKPVGTVDIPPNVTSFETRSELLQYGTILTLDPKTAHKRIVLSDGFTVASVSDEHADYPDCPERFSVCSQVLASKGFSRGRHYWEVRLSSNNFVSIGLAYKSVDRKGPTSRLGRNAQSWCVEWFNVKLSAWFNSSETVLENPNSKRVGVLLDCDNGAATFYNVADRAYPFHSFVFPFAEAVYPAFWIFSSGSSVTLCKLQ